MMATTFPEPIFRFISLMDCMEGRRPSSAQVDLQTQAGLKHAVSPEYFRTSQVISRFAFQIVANPDLPSVADIHISRIRKPAQFDQRLEPVLQITGKGTRELRIRQHAMLFVGLRVSMSFLGSAILL